MYRRIVGHVIRVRHLPFPENHFRVDAIKMLPDFAYAYGGSEVWAMHCSPLDLSVSVECAQKLMLLCVQLVFHVGFGQI